MENWIVVLSDDDASKRQLEVCKELKPPLDGVVMCDRDNQSALCSEVRQFPTFCNKDTNMCTHGLRDTLEQLNELQTL